MCVYAHMSVWVCERVHVIAHACRQTHYSPNPKEMRIDSLPLPVYIYIYLYIVYPEYIFDIYPESAGFNNSQDDGQNSHGDYKNTVSRVEYRM